MGHAQIPKYKVGDHVGVFEVTYYCGHTPVGPNGVKLNKAHHWYEVECTCCGAADVVNQHRLPRRIACKECGEGVRQPSTAEQYRALQPPGVPDFRTMRLTRTRNV